MQPGLLIQKHQDESESESMEKVKESNILFSLQRILKKPQLVFLQNGSGVAKHVLMNLLWLLRNSSFYLYLQSLP